ncbi:hypothetical protein MTO96_030802 [Rhipicephalus appendiculatus]
MTAVRGGFTVTAVLATAAVVLLLGAVTCEDPHEGLYIGKINTYAHQVSGHVYAIDEYTILIKNFFYDGLGQDAFFWAGSSVRPSNVGFIVPDEEGKTNKLQPYTDKDIYLQLPNKRKITSIRWFAVWNLRENANYGDIFFPRGFRTALAQADIGVLPAWCRSALGHGRDRGFQNDRNPGLLLQRQRLGYLLLGRPRTAAEQRRPEDPR